MCVREGEEKEENARVRTDGQQNARARGDRACERRRRNNHLRNAVNFGFLVEVEMFASTMFASTYSCRSQIPAISSLSGRAPFPRAPDLFVRSRVSTSQPFCIFPIEKGVKREGDTVLYSSLEGASKFQRG